jgi:hypothetical protein
MCRVFLSDDAELARAVVPSVFQFRPPSDAICDLQGRNALPVVFSRRVKQAVRLQRLVSETPYYICSSPPEARFGGRSVRRSGGRLFSVRRLTSTVDRTNSLTPNFG